MIHKTLQQLYDRIKRTKTEDGLLRIEGDCGWTNCAVGTKLREIGLDLANTKGVSNHDLVLRLVKPEIYQEGKRFNSLLQNGQKKEALQFIKTLQKLTPVEFFKPT